MLPWIAVLLACTSDPVPPQTAVQRFECNRCHEGAGGTSSPQDRSCIGCHTAIRTGGLDTERYDPEYVARWRANLRHFVEVPTITGADDRFERSWFIDFVQEPQDLRPQLDETMPRLAVDASQAEELADALGLIDRVPSPVEGDAERGVERLAERGCTTCHAFTGATVGPPSAPGVTVTAAALARAPDLRWTRERMAPQTIERWLADPSAVKPDSAMPRIPLTPEERADLVAAIVKAPLAEVQLPALPERLPVLARSVRHPEVEERVFKKVCWHCHSDGSAGDAGPGKSGGFGFPGVDLDLGSHGGILHGTADGDGRSSVVARTDSPPRLVRHLMARHAEVSGAPVPGVRGMPLGLPPLPLEDIQLVETWIAQGALP